MSTNSWELRQEVEHQVLCRTGRQIRDLAVELRQGWVVLRGRASSYYLKQLAQHGVRDVLPSIALENAISVDSDPKTAR
jgi:osmotically-inducible protein OsmY